MGKKSVLWVGVGWGICVICASVNGMALEGGDGQARLPGQDVELLAGRSVDRRENGVESDIAGALEAHIDAERSDEDMPSKAIASGPGRRVNNEVFGGGAAEKGENDWLDSADTFFAHESTQVSQRTDSLSDACASQTFGRLGRANSDAASEYSGVAVGIAQRRLVRAGSVPLSQISLIDEALGAANKAVAATTRYCAKIISPEIQCNMAGLDDNGMAATRGEGDVVGGALKKEYETEAAKTREIYDAVDNALTEGRMPDDIQLAQLLGRVSIAMSATLYQIYQMRNQWDGNTVKDDQKALKLLGESRKITLFQGEKIPQLLRGSVQRMRRDLRENLKKSTALMPEHKDLIPSDDDLPRLQENFTYSEIGSGLDDVVLVDKLPPISKYESGTQLGSDAGSDNSGVAPYIGNVDYICDEEESSAPPIALCRDGALSSSPMTKLMETIVEMTSKACAATVVGTSKAFAATQRAYSKWHDPQFQCEMSGLSEIEVKKTRKIYYVVDKVLQEGRMPTDAQLSAVVERELIAMNATLYVIKEMRKLFRGPTITNHDQAIKLLSDSRKIARFQSKEISDSIRRSAKLMRGVVRTELSKSKSLQDRYKDELVLSDEEVV